MFKNKTRLPSLMQNSFDSIKPVPSPGELVQIKIKALPELLEEMMKTQQHPTIMIKDKKGITTAGIPYLLNGSAFDSWLKPYSLNNAFYFDPKNGIHQIGFYKFQPCEIAKAWVLKGDYPLLNLEKYELHIKE
jgi:hypothetical protein